MAKDPKKGPGGGGGNKSVNMGSALVDQHRRMATGHMGTVNKMPLKKGGAACMKKGGRGK